MSKNPLQFRRRKSAQPGKTTFWVMHLPAGAQPTVTFSVMPELLLELGTEELPATAVRPAYTQLRNLLESALTEAKVLTGDASSTAIGTPRRLIVRIQNVAARQEDSIQEKRGPGLKGAYTADGQPTPALLGFCRGQGVELSDLTNDGQYVWAKKLVPGQACGRLLQSLIPTAIHSLTFEKTMRWGSSRMRFARPIRWILATFDQEVVDFEIEGVPSGNQSCGHRFYAPERFKATNFEQLVEGLRSRMVEPDPDIRKRRIVDGVVAVASGEPLLPEALVDENVFLTEWPIAISGSFLPSYLELPKPVLETAMAKHERMFPVQNAEGKLINSFVFVRNSGQDDSVRAGCEWVLNARFNDARFFFDEDKKWTMGHFLEKTSTILYAEKLGTVRERSERLLELSDSISELTAADETESEYLRQAAKFAKADLSTGLVSELASLQGIIGGAYAARDGFAEPVCWAISSQYDLSRNPEPDSPGARTAVRLIIADQLDKLAGYLGLGLEPKGSSDPYALRRAATMLIEAALSWPSPVDAYYSSFIAALKGYEHQGVVLNHQTAIKSLQTLFLNRYQSLMPGVRYDVLEAACRRRDELDVLAPQRVQFKVQVLESLVEDVDFVQTATRPLNILSAAIAKKIKFEQVNPLQQVDIEKLQSKSGQELHQALILQNEQIGKAVEARDLSSASASARELQLPINRFFDDTMMMVDEAEVRHARLTLLNAAAEQLFQIGDFSKIVLSAKNPTG